MDTEEAAKDWVSDRFNGGVSDNTENHCIAAFLAGASFNSKDEAKESDQDKYWSRAISMIEVADTDGEDYLIKYKELHEKLKSKFSISIKQNSDHHKDAGEFAEWASHSDWTYLPSKKLWYNEEDEENITPKTTQELYNLFKQIGQ